MTNPTRPKMPRFARPTLKWLALAIALLLLLWLTNSHLAPIARAASLSLPDVFNARGTLELASGKTGALDVRGLGVQLDPQRGPVLAPNAPTANGWTGLGNGVNDYVFALAVMGDDVYVGGSFTQICGNPACDAGNVTMNRLARWSTITKSWSTVNNGVNNVVYALAVTGTDLYVGGAFNRACGNSACNSGNFIMNRVGKYATTTGNWSALGSGVNSNVHALAFQGSMLYVGGHFNQVCGTNDCSLNILIVNHIAAWSTATNLWSALGNGVDDDVNAIGVSSVGIFVGGAFTRICSNSACNAGLMSAFRVAKYDNGTWSKLNNGATDGNGVNGVVHAILIKDGVYLGGEFTQICTNVFCTTGTTVNHVALWVSGGFWGKLGNGTNGTVRAFVLDGSDIYVAGSFLYLCGNAACDTNNVRVNDIAKWTGSWSPLANGVFGGLYALARKEQAVFVGGIVDTICGNTACNSGGTPINSVAQYGPLPPTLTPTPTKTSTPTQTPTKTLTPTVTPTNGCNAKPLEPTLLKPVNAAQITAKRPKLKWSDVQCETRYKLRVRRDATNGLIVVKRKQPETKFKAPLLEGGHTYYWFVKACNSFGCSKKTWHSFTVLP